jgi:ribosomal protein L31E
MNENIKGGRPSKEQHKKRKYQVNIKLMTEEYYTLKARANEAAMPINDFVRNAIQHSEVKQRLTPEVNDHIRKLSGLANNFNQLTKLAHQSGYENIRNEYLYIAENIDNLINYIKHDR